MSLKMTCNTICFGHVRQKDVNLQFECHSICEFSTTMNKHKICCSIFVNMCHYATTFIPSYIYKYINQQKIITSENFNFSY